jgi:hypothetical protein
MVVSPRLANVLSVMIWGVHREAFALGSQQTVAGGHHVPSARRLARNPSGVRPPTPTRPDCPAQCFHRLRPTQGDLVNGGQPQPILANPGQPRSNSGQPTSRALRYSAFLQPS